MSRAHGRLTIITGPMFSGKTTELLRLFERKVIAEVHCMLCKYKGDNRYDTTAVTSHHTLSGQRMIPARSISTISELFDETIVDYDSIFIDEIQFFPDKGQIAHLLDIGIDVIVSGLNGDWKRQMFPGMDHLFAMACNINMLHAVCGFCKSDDACYSCLISTDRGEIIIGGDDKYKAACLHCYLRYSAES